MEHRRPLLYIADATTLDSFVAPSSVDLVLTGPPYWDEVVYSHHTAQLSTSPSYAAFLADIGRVWSACAHVLREGGVLAYWAHDLVRTALDGGRRYFPLHHDLAQVMPLELERRAELVWDRYLASDRGSIPGSGGTRVQYVSLFQKKGRHARNEAQIAAALTRIYWEPVWQQKTSPRILGSSWLYRAIFASARAAGFVSSIRRFKSPLGFALSDPYVFSAYATECPPEVARRLIADFTRPGDEILDPFVGSGTTLKVASEMGRASTGFDINEGVVSVVLQKVPDVEVRHVGNTVVTERVTR